MTNQPIIIEDTDLDIVNGAGLLLPAVQKVREAAARMTTAGSDVTGDGVRDLLVFNGK